MNLQENSKIYFIGIGGIAMSAAAGIASKAGYEVLGSDSKEVYDPAKSVLDELGIPYKIGYDASSVEKSGADIFVASAGEDLSNPEVKFLRDQETAIYSLSELLFELAKDKLRIVITGTHGKSTTSSLFGKVLQNIDDSSFMTGAVLQEENRNFHYGEGHYFVFEGDEYKALFDDPTPKFQQYSPDIAVLTNLEFDHPDVFSSLEEIQNEFYEMLEKMPQDGLVVYNSDDAELIKLLHRTNLGQVSFGIDHPADYRVVSMSIQNDTTSFSVEHKEKEELYHIPLFGKMNVYNALAVVATLRTLGFSKDLIQHGFDEYTGIKRRFEFVGEFNGAKIFDDYAHHPTAISQTLSAARLRFPDSKIWAIFEPHTFSRTEAVLEDLAKSFDAADEVLISEIYPARERKTPTSISSEQVVAEISKFEPNTRLVHDREEAKNILENEIATGDVVIVMAVGSFNLLAKELVA